MALELHISVLDGETVKDTVVLSSGVHRTAKIGRMASAAVRLEDPSIARIHAVIEVGAEEAVLVDMGTTAGTRLGDEKVQRSVLSHGDRIGIGNTVLLVGIGKAASVAPDPDVLPESLSEQISLPSVEVPSEETIAARDTSQSAEVSTDSSTVREYQVEQIHDPDAPELVTSGMPFRTDVPSKGN